MDFGVPPSMYTSAEHQNKGKKRKKKSANESTASKAPGEDVVNVSVSSRYVAVVPWGGSV